MGDSRGGLSPGQAGGWGRSATDCKSPVPMTMCVINCFLFVHKFDIALEIVSRCAQNERKMHTNFKNTKFTALGTHNGVVFGPSHGEQLCTGTGVNGFGTDLHTCSVYWSEKLHVSYRQSTLELLEILKEFSVPRVHLDYCCSGDYLLQYGSTLVGEVYFKK